jgi:heptosyltransferase-3/putative inorganic carbon (HCO3(-)) transporter
MKQTIEVDSGSSDAKERVNLRARSVIQQLQTYGLAVITFMSFFPVLFHFQEYAFFGLLALGVSLSWIDRRNPFVRTPIDVPLLAFIGWVLCTIPFAIDPAYSFSEWRKFVAHVLIFYWGMFVLRQYDEDHKVTRQVVWAVILGSLALSGYALEDFISRGGTWRDRLVRAGAPNSDYNWLTTYLVLVLPVLIAWVFIRQSVRMRTLGLVSVLAVVFAQIAAYTRAGWVAHIVQAISWGMVTGRKRLILGFFAGAIAMGAVLLTVSKTGYQQETMDPWTLQARVKTWKLGLNDLVQHPLVGVGYGNYTFYKMHTVEIEAEKHKTAEEKVLPGLHSTLAIILVGSGVPALFFFAWTIVRIIRELAGGIRALTLREASMRLLPPAIALSVIGFMVRNAFDYMFAGTLASLFWILVAVGLFVKTGAQDVSKECRVSR